MLTLFAFMMCPGGIDRELRPKQPQPVIPIPTGITTRWDYRLDTDWMPLTRAMPVWRTCKRLDDSGRWESAVIGQPGGRCWEFIAENEFHRATATTGRNRLGSGGIGEGFKSSVFVGESWTADLDVEFTSNGLRVVVALAYYPFEGITHRYGWSVLSGQVVRSRGWHFTADDLCSIYYMPRFAVMMSLYPLREALGLTREE